MRRKKWCSLRRSSQPISSSLSAPRRVILFTWRRISLEPTIHTTDATTRKLATISGQLAEFWGFTSR